jgi:hypothetical protein
MRPAFTHRIALAALLLVPAASVSAQPADTPPPPPAAPEPPFLPGSVAFGGGLMIDPGVNGVGTLRIALDKLVFDVSAGRTLLAGRGRETVFALDASIPWRRLHGPSLRSSRAETIGLGLRSTDRGGSLPVTSALAVFNVGLLTRHGVEFFGAQHAGVVVIGERQSAEGGYVEYGYSRGNLIWASSIGVRIYP